MSVETGRDESFDEADLRPRHSRGLRILHHLIELIILALFLAAISSTPYHDVWGLKMDLLRVDIVHQASGGSGGHPRTPSFDAASIATAASLVVAALGLSLLVRSWKRRAEGRQSFFYWLYTSSAGTLSCFIILAVLSVDLYYWCRPVRHLFSEFMSSIDRSFESVGGGGLIFIMLIASRFFRRPAPFALLLVFFLGGLIGIRFYNTSYPLAQELIQEYSVISAPFPGRSPGILVPMVAMPVRFSLMVLLPFLAALYAVRRGFAWWKWIVGWLAAWVVLKGVLFRALPELEDLRFVLLNLAFTVLLIRLPYQRRILETFTGYPLAKDKSSQSLTPTSLFCSMVKYAVAVLMGLLVTGFAFVGYFEQKVGELVTVGAPAPAYSPALVNAYTTLGPLFRRNEMIEIKTPKDMADYNLVTFNSYQTLEDFQKIFSIIDIPALEKQIAPYEEGMRAFTEAAKADYCLFHDGTKVVLQNFINLRTVSWTMLCRTRLRIHQGRPAEALQEIETLLKLTRLLNTDPCGSLVHHMIAVAIRGIALSAANDYFICFRGDPTAMELMRQMLDRCKPLVRFDFPHAIIERTEMAFLPVVPYFEVTVPGMIKADQTFYARWAQFDLLVLAVALEDYRRDNGRYPDTLEALSPKYLERLPRDPFEAKAYLYENRGGDFFLSLAKDPKLCHFPVESGQGEKTFNRVIEEYKKAKAKSAKREVAQ